MVTFNEDTQIDFRPDAKNWDVVINSHIRDRGTCSYQDWGFQRQWPSNNPTRNNVTPGYKTPNQKKRISALQSQGVKDLLIEKVYIIILFSI